MICILALIVFSVMSIFSAKYRPFATAAFDCVFRKMTLRPCNTAFDEKVKADILAALLPRSPPLARFVNINFEAISWLFTILFFASMIYSAYGFYMFMTTGSCDPQNPSAFCVYRDVLGSTAEGQVCHDELNTGAEFSEKTLIAPSNPLGISSGNPSAQVEVVEFACFSCPFTKQTEEAVQSLIKNRGGNIHFVTIQFPLPSHAYSRDSALATLCAANPSEGKIIVENGQVSYLPVEANASIPDSARYWAFRQAIFNRLADVQSNGRDGILRAAKDSHMPSEFYSCFNKSEAIYGPYLDARIAQGKASKVFGTPTFFVNGKPLVGYTDYSKLSSAVDAAFANISN